MDNNGKSMMELTDLRYTLAMDRIRAIPGEHLVPPAFEPYFEDGAKWFLLMEEEEEFLKSDRALSEDEDHLRERNYKLYEEILPQNYKVSWANPSFASDRLGEKYGPLLSALRYEIRCVIPFVYRLLRERVLIRAEVFLEVYTAFTVAFRESGNVPSCEQIRSIIRQYLADYAEDEMLYYLGDKLVGGSARIYDIAVKRPSQIRNLYLTGEYVTEDEITSARHIAGLSQEEIARIAGTITEGYRRGFVNGGKNLASKKNAAVIAHLGFERIIRECIAGFEKLGLKVILSSEVPTLFHSFSKGETGYSGADPNPQYFYDHREDLALFLDESLRIRRLEGLTNAYRKLRDKTVLYAGPAVLETFGAKPFSPRQTRGASRLSKAQQKICTEYSVRSARLYSEAVVAKDRSYTIIDFPLPSVAENTEKYREIFDAVIKINTLDNALFERIQGRMTDVLGLARTAQIQGKNGNRTCLTVKLHEPSDPASEANFVNCTADVNIPVGEVYTTPVLEGTNGILHVKGVYLDGLFYRDLMFRFEEGKIAEYSCANFESEEENRNYIRENILHHHDSLPMGELAIGTNTTAYAAAAKYGISDRLPILIAEKTGPHFAVGDTCFCRDEENRVYNPDGKEIVAKDNSVSILRKTDPENAYFGCHTDITIPYEELLEFTAVNADGSRTPILYDVRFVLDGTQILNGPLDALSMEA